jgi:ligand-binding sensor domain-containing protein
MSYNYAAWIHTKMDAVYLAATILLCIPFCIAHAQNINYQFENITNEQGLADRLINTIIQDAQGYIWIGSNEGLTKYDGYSCVVYRHKTNDNYSLSDNEIYALCLDKEGVLWIGTHKGLNRYDVLHDRFDVFLHNSSDVNTPGGNEIFSLAKDSSGNIWAGTLDGGLDMMVNPIEKAGDIKSNYHFVHYRYNAKDSNSISDNQILSICFDNQHRGWIGTASGLNILNIQTKKFIRLYHRETIKNSISNNVVNKIFPDKQGDIWLCGKAMLDKVSTKFIKKQNDISVQHYLPSLSVSKKTSDWIINDFITDHQGTAWVATNNNGLIKFHTVNQSHEMNSFEQFINNTQLSFSLASSTVYCLYEDKSGVIWVGTANGVSKYIP